MYARRAPPIRRSPPLRLAFEAEIESVPRPVVLRGQNYALGISTEMHVHGRSQLVLAESGTMIVSAGSGIWAVPPHRAVWIPAGVEHSVQSNRPVDVRSIFVDPARTTRLRECCMVSISPLLRELILYAIKLPRLYAIGSPEERVMTVLLEQLEAAPLAPLYLPIPRDRRLRRIALALLENPADNRSASEWGRAVGASSRTLSRLFPSETGMSFRRWQQNARILEAVRRLSVGQTVGNVALDVGYESPSAFVLMFKRIMGTTPGQFLENLP